MPHWLIKSALHRAISLLPASHFWNGLLQQYLSHTTKLPKQQFETRLDYCYRHLEAFLQSRPAQTGDWRLGLAGGLRRRDALEDEEAVRVVLDGETESCARQPIRAPSAVKDKVIEP